MSQVFLITENSDLAGAVTRYLHSRGSIQVISTTSPRQLNGTAQGNKAQWVPHNFSRLADWLERSAEQATAGKFGLFNALCLIEVPALRSIADLEPIDRTKDWPAVVGMLILAFPEIHWGIITSDKSALLDDNDRRLAELHFVEPHNFCERLDELVELQEEGFSPLFDPGGLRNTLRQRLVQRPQAQYIPLRAHRAVTIDEEESYTYFNAYVAYRFGFRCDVVTSHQRMTNLLGEANQEPITISFEDIFLNFADRRKSLSRLEERDERCPALATIPNRIFITSGHSRTQTERETTRLNNLYICQLRSEHNYHIRTLFKPESGVFDLWRQSGARDRFATNDGRAPGFIWPPKNIAEGSSLYGTHSAPGRLLWIAERLIQRASQIRGNVDSVTQAVYGATLTLDAQEYLGHRTPTSSLDAIALKHELEALAECMFYGVEYHLDTKARFNEIEKEIDCIGTWFREETRQSSELNAEIGIISDLVLAFRNYNQFSEEQAALTKLRELHRRLWVKRHSPWSWLVWPFRYYLDTLLSSIPVFVLALFVWVFVFGAAYSRVAVHIHRDDGPNPESQEVVLHGMEDAVAAFFGMQSPHDFGDFEAASETAVWLTILIILMGFVHLGIFVSHLYSIVSRR